MAILTFWLACYETLPSVTYNTDTCNLWTCRETWPFYWLTQLTNSHLWFSFCPLSFSWSRKWLLVSVDLGLVLKVSESFFCFEPVFISVIAVKGHQDHGNSYKRKHLAGIRLQFRVLIHYHHGRKHSSTQADMGWRSSWEFYIRIHRQQEEHETGPGLSI